MLSIIVVEGQLLRDTDVVTKMDPYVLVTIGNETKKTSVAQGQGKTPVWNSTLTFTEQNNLLKIVVKDEDIASDDLVGEGVFDIKGAFMNPNVIKTFPIEVFYQNKSAGKILVTVVWKTL